MKKIINKLIFIFALLPLLAGCEKDKEIVVVEPVENYTQLYGLGTIFSWDSNVPTELKLIEQNTFTIDKVIKYSEENKQFKFILEKGDWDKVRYLVPTATDDGTAVKVITPGEYADVLRNDRRPARPLLGNTRRKRWHLSDYSERKEAETNPRKDQR